MFNVCCYTLILIDKKWKICAKTQYNFMFFFLLPPKIQTISCTVVLWNIRKDVSQVRRCFPFHPHSGMKILLRKHPHLVRGIKSLIYLFTHPFFRNIECWRRMKKMCLKEWKSIRKSFLNSLSTGVFFWHWGSLKKQGTFMSTPSIRSDFLSRVSTLRFLSY